MPSIIKYIAFRLIFLLAILFASNKLYEMTYWKSDIAKHGDILENVWQLNDEVEVVYFGESSNFHGTIDDSNQHAISTVLDRLLPNLKVGVVHNSGIHSGTYYSAIQNIKEDSKVRYLVITMNFRSFTASWRYSHSENYLAKTERMLEPGLPIVNRFLVSLRAYDYKSNKERTQQLKDEWLEPLGIKDFEFDNVQQWDSAMAWQTWLDINPNLTKENIGLACHYIKNFAFNIDTLTNEIIHDFDNIMDFAKQRNYKVVFNLLGENTDEANKLVGDNLLELMENNRQLLIDRYTKQGAIIVDNLYNIPDSCFVDRDWPTEHYNQTGKNIIASDLAKTILLLEKKD